MSDYDMEILPAPEICHRCQGELLLTVSVPHSFVRADGGRVHGSRRVPLCPVCDKDVPAAQDLLAFFAVREIVASEDVEDVGVLLAQWAEHAAAPPQHSESDFDEDPRQ